MRLIKGFKTELFPNTEQAQYLEILFNISRYSWNKLHELKKDSNSSKHQFACVKELQTLIPEEFEPFHNRLLYAVAKDYSDAWQACFRKIRRAPKFHSEIKNHASVSFCSLNQKTLGISCKEHKELAFKNLLLKEPVPGFISAKRITFSRHNGKYFISASLEMEVPEKESENNSIGLDLGIKTFATDNTGKKYKLPKRILRIQARINRLNKILSGKQKGSNKRQQVITKLERAHDRKSNIAKDFTEKLSTKLLQTNTLIGLETVDISEWKKGKGKLGNNKLAASCLGRFRDRLVQKSKEYPHCKIVFIDKYYPSTQICSKCGHSHKLTLKERTYTCSECGNSLDRDHNAAINILTEALRISV